MSTTSLLIAGCLFVVIVCVLWLASRFDRQDDFEKHHDFPEKKDDDIGDMGH